MQQDAELKEMVLSTLSKDQCERIHAAALQILKKTGVVFQSEEALAIFKNGGARVDGERVYIPESLVDWALKTVPHTFTLHDQEGNPKHEVGARNCLYGPGSDCLNILDHRTGEHRAPLVKDLEELVTLCDGLDNIDFLMSMIIPTDIPRGGADRKQMEIMLNHSTKPIIGVSFHYEGTRDIIAMAENVAGNAESLRERPFFIHYIQPVRALLHNEDTVRKLLYTAKKGLPCLYLVSAIMGVSSPITAAGYQAMGAAGQLAALVLAQFVREGTPFVVRGGRIVVMDMKTMLSTFAAPENRIFSSDMAHFYNLPCFGTAGCGDSKLPDWQAVSEASLTLMADSLVGANLIHDVGYIEAGVTYSAEMLALCDEIISWIRQFKKGAPVNDDTLALDLIDELGIEGDFLSCDHTLARYREQWEPGIFDRNTYQGWQAAGSTDAKEKVRRKIDRILSEHVCRKLPADVQRELKSISDRVEEKAGVS
ncbi:MAG: trimethylamine methyltransferase family protein [Armatimonadetes bacterium]|nr:trimethylamine methyltransferase family protein [Armatimonadota bacterium]